MGGPDMAMVYPLHRTLVLLACNLNASRIQALFSSVTPALPADAPSWPGLARLGLRRRPVLRRRLPPHGAGRRGARGRAPVPRRPGRAVGLHGDPARRLPGDAG